MITSKMDKEFLTQPCKDIPVETSMLKTIITDLLDTARCHKDRCAGLAANQIGYPYRVFAVKWCGDFLIIINPVITKRSEKRHLSTEGCLSIPGRKKKVMRHKMIKAKYFDHEAGHFTTQTFRGFDAIVFQHEHDHGDGVLI